MMYLKVYKSIDQLISECDMVAVLLAVVRQRCTRIGTIPRRL